MKSENNKAVGNVVIQSWYFPLIRKKTELVSIPRDTKAEIAGRGTEEKLTMPMLMAVLTWLLKQLKN